MTDIEREALELRVIATSARAALTSQAGDDPLAADRIRRRGDELLANLEQRVIREGGNDELLRRIDEERHRLSEQRATEAAVAAKPRCR